MLHFMGITTIVAKGIWECLVKPPTWPLCTFLENLLLPTAWYPIQCCFICHLHLWSLSLLRTWTWIIHRICCPKFLLCCTSFHSGLFNFLCAVKGSCDFDMLCLVSLDEGGWERQDDAVGLHDVQYRSWLNLIWYVPASMAVCPKWYICRVDSHAVHYTGNQYSVYIMFRYQRDWWRITHSWWNNNGCLSMLSSQHWHPKHLMLGRKDLKHIKYNECVATCGICQNFKNAASDDFVIILKNNNPVTCSDQCNRLTNLHLMLILQRSMILQNTCLQSEKWQIGTVSSVNLVLGSPVWSSYWALQVSNQTLTSQDFTQMSN